MWELSLFAQLWRVFLRYGSQMCRHHTCSFLSAAACVKVIATSGCETNHPDAAKGHLQDTNESTQRRLEGIGNCAQSDRGGVDDNRAQTKINVTDYFALLVKKTKKTKTFIQNRWPLCKRKRGCFRDSQRKTSSSGKEKKKKGTCSSHHISCLNPL